MFCSPALPPGTELLLPVVHSFYQSCGLPNWTQEKLWVTATICRSYCRSSCNDSLVASLSLLTPTCLLSFSSKISFQLVGAQFSTIAMLNHIGIGIISEQHQDEHKAGAACEQNQQLFSQSKVFSGALIFQVQKLVQCPSPEPHRRPTTLIQIHLRPIFLDKFSHLVQQQICAS